MNLLIKHQNSIRALFICTFFFVLLKPDKEKLSQTLELTAISKYFRGHSFIYLQTSFHNQDAMKGQFLKIPVFSAV